MNILTLSERYRDTSTFTFPALLCRSVSDCQTGFFGRQRYPDQYGED